MDKKYLPENNIGNNISLKRFDIDLAQKMFDYIDSDRERLSKFLPWPDFIKTVDDEKEYIKKVRQNWEDFSVATFGIFRNSDDDYMGNISAFGLNWTHHNVEIGYWILGKFEGHGYMSEAVNLLEQVIFEMGFNRIVIRCDPENVRSRSIPQRNGYKFEGTQREIKFYRDSYHDLEVYSKIKSEWKKIQSG